MKTKNLILPPYTIQRVIDILKGIKEFRVKDRLPFGTCDYLEIDGCIEYLESLKRPKVKKC